MVESGGLENRCIGNPGTEGSNPSPSASESSSCRDAGGVGDSADVMTGYVTILTVGYMVSRGLAKSGSRERSDFDDE